MTHAPRPPALVVRGPDSLPALVPHLVGFHPHDSLVVLGLAPGARTVLLTLRIDLPPAGISDEGSDAFVCSLIGPLQRSHVREVILAVYPTAADDPWRTAHAGELPMRPLVWAVADELEDTGITALDAVCVVRDRVRSYWCKDISCCPAEGRQVEPVESLRVRATFVEHGSAPLESRSALVAGLAAREVDDPMRVRVDQARDGVVVRMPAGTQAQVARFLHDVTAWGAEPRSIVTLTRLVVVAGWLCASIRSRDLLLHALTLDADRRVLGAARSVLGEAVRCAEGADIAPVAAALAVCCWVDGDGAAARVALDRALGSDPAYSLATLVTAALDAGAPPCTWTQIMTDLSVADILGGEFADEHRPGA